MTNYTLQELELKIIGWADDKNLIQLNNAPKQRLKLIEEAGELANAILKSNVKEQKDAIGDIFVVLVILAAQMSYKLHLGSFHKWEDDVYSPNKDELLSEIIQYSKLGSLMQAICTLNNLSESIGYDLTDCANLAWNEIKDRVGVTKDGTFIKN